MSNVEINQVLQQMRAVASMTEGTNQVEQGGEIPGLDFTELVKNSLNKVNETQQAASDLATAFETGDPTVNLSEVMVAIQKASISFQAMTQVRNNLVSAYKEVMNMQV